MKKIIPLISLLFCVNVFAADANEKWNPSSLSEETMKAIQTARYDYKKCVSDEMQKSAYQKMDSRKATDEIMKQCEPYLGKMREVYIKEEVPEIIADRHLKQLRIQTTRTALQELMYVEAARKSGE